VTSILFIEDNKKSVLISGSEDSTVKVWNAEDNSYSNLKTLFGHYETITSVIFIRKAVIASSSLDKNIKVWNYEKADCIYTLSSHDLGISQIIDFGNCYNNSEDSFIISTSHDKTIKLWNLNSKKCVLTIKEHNDKVNAIVHCKKYEARTIITGSSDKTLKIFRLNYNDNKSLYTLYGHEADVTSVNYLYKCDKNMIISGSTDKTIRIWSVDLGRYFNKFNLEEDVEKDLNINVERNISPGCCVMSFFYCPEFANKFILLNGCKNITFYSFYYNKKKERQQDEEED
jgi:WD40 repeat protein